MTDPERLTVQDIVGSWWEKATPALLEPGRLVRTFVPYPDVMTHGLVMEGRRDDRDHKAGLFRVEPIQKGRPGKLPFLPLAALSAHPGESFIVQRGKQRPALVLSVGADDIPRTVLQGGAGYQRHSCVLVLPYYGADQDGSRGGFPPAFIEQARRTAYAQYLLDELPLGGTNQSVLRLDHVFAVGRADSNFELTDFRLVPDALNVVRDWFRWLVEGKVPAESLLKLIRAELTEMEAVN